jgi:hypothetical protein
VEGEEGVRGKRCGGSERARVKEEQEERRSMRRREERICKI